MYSSPSSTPGQKKHKFFYFFTIFGILDLHLKLREILPNLRHVVWRLDDEIECISIQENQGDDTSKSASRRKRTST